MVGIAERYGYRPMMWSDMFFRIFTPEGDGFSDYDLRVELPKNAAELVPPGVQQVFWDYYHTDGEFYRQNLIKHRLLGKDTVFAGGVWLWSGHSPLFSRSLANTLPALDACRDTGTREILATVWHNGSEAALPLSLAGIAWYADYDYRGYYSEEGVRNTFRAATGEAYDDFLKAELPEYPHGGRGPLSRALLYNDPLCGLADKTAYGYVAKYLEERRIKIPKAEIGHMVTKIMGINVLVSNTISIKRFTANKKSKVTNVKMPSHMSCLRFFMYVL